MIEGMTVTKVKGFGKQKGHSSGSSETTRISFVPKVRVDVVVREWDVPHIMAVIRDATNTGHVGDGKIFVLDATEAMRVRTGERGTSAV